MSNLIRKLSIPKAKPSTDIDKMSNRTPSGRKPVDGSRPRVPKPDKQPVIYQLQPPEPKLRHRAASVSTTTIIVPVEPKDEFAAFSMQLADAKTFAVDSKKAKAVHDAFQRGIALEREVYKAKKKAPDAAPNGVRPQSPVKIRK
jgi:hypothetical protein